MSLIRYSFPESTNWPSYDRLSTLRDEVNRLFDISQPTRDRGLSSGWSPALDVHEDKDRLTVQVELPGLQKDQIDISLRDGVLTVSGERKTERERKEGEVFRSERYFGKFQRSVTLPASVDAGSVKAAYKDGILTIGLPKAEAAKPKQIAISAS